MKIKITVERGAGEPMPGLTITELEFHVSPDPVAECERCGTIHKGPAAEKMLDTIDTPCPNCGGECFVPWAKPVCREDDRIYGVANVIDVDEIESAIVVEVRAAIAEEEAKR